jgi:hypothetical protein
MIADNHLYIYRKYPGISHGAQAYFPQSASLGLTEREPRSHGA